MLLNNIFYLLIPQKTILPDLLFISGKAENVVIMSDLNQHIIKLLNYTTTIPKKPDYFVVILFKK